MKILIDIGHPAHVHYFRELIGILKIKGHEIIVSARDKEITHKLLIEYKIKYYNRGKGKNGLLGKLFYLFYGVFKVLKLAKQNKTELFLSFASPYASIASFLFRKPSIVLDDTEHNHFNHKIYSTFSKVSIHPKSFKKKLGIKQLFFDGTMEDAYLRNFSINKSTTSVTKNILVRFVSWGATHDRNEYGFTYTEKINLISTLNKLGNVFISSESKLPHEFLEYKLNIEPHEFHEFLSKMDLLVGESGSVATEAAYLGISSIVLNSASSQFGVFERFKNAKLLYIARNSEDAIQTSKQYLDTNKINDNYQLAYNYRKSTIDLNKFLVWFIENYPESFKIMKETPDYQYHFK